MEQPAVPVRRVRHARRHRPYRFLMLSVAVIGVLISAGRVRAVGATLVGPVCGNGIFETGEQCDDGNLFDGDGCDSNCTLTVCGNGIVTTGEQCDDGNAVDGDECDSSCTRTACGNGIVTAAEQCDDGNLVAGDGCDSDCTFTSCGNGIVTSGEQCDDANFVDGDGCDSNCTVTACGNGVVAAGEQCDDGNTNSDDGCAADCTAEAGWACPTPGQPCQPVCGDGFVLPSEQCDDGNLVDGDGCDSNCTVTACGNGVRTAGEQCDDGNTVSGDGCEADCQLVPLVCHDTCAQGAHLDPGCNPCVASICAHDPYCCAIGWDDVCVHETESVCGVSCAICGNGVIEFREQCDDGNTAAGDGCEADCTFTAGFTTPFTQCPPIAPGTGCGVLLEVLPTGGVIPLVDVSQVSYDVDETLVGVHNGSDRLVASIALSSDSVPIFDLDNDGLCTPLTAPAGCPFGPTGYEGPGVFFSIHAQGAGIVYFAPALRPGDTAYFSLEEKISWGQLQAQLNPVKPFQCHSGRVLAAQPPIAPVRVVDALTGFTARVRGLHDVCAPTNEDGENPTAGSDPNHLESYVVAPQKPKPLQPLLPLRNQVVANQFGLLLLDVTWPDRLLVPTTTSRSDTPPAPLSPAVDHFTCYKVKRSKYARAFTPLHDVRLADQYGTAAVTVGRPTRLCLPANQNDAAPGAERHGDRLLCYRLSGREDVGRVFTNNQFGPGIFYPRGRDELCVPSVMAR
jgi:cysteine-rich repeat protein